MQPATPYPQPLPTEVHVLPETPSDLPLDHNEQLRSNPVTAATKAAEAPVAVAEPAAPASTGRFSLPDFPNLEVIESESKLGGRGGAVVLIECTLGQYDDPQGFGAAIEALQGPVPRKLAMIYASKLGVIGPTCGWSGQSSYPVDRDGNDASERGEVYRYRTSITINGASR